MKALSDHACLFFPPENRATRVRQSGVNCKTLKTEAAGCFETLVTTTQATDTITQTTAGLISTALNLVYLEQKVYNVQICTQHHWLRSPCRSR